MVSLFGTSKEVCLLPGEPAASEIRKTSAQRELQKFRKETIKADGVILCGSNRKIWS